LSVKYQRFGGAAVCARTLEIIGLTQRNRRRPAQVEYSAFAGAAALIAVAANGVEPTEENINRVMRKVIKTIAPVIELEMDAIRKRGGL
jgi:hypothetical protein